MTTREQLSALEGLTRSSGWLIFREELQRRMDAAEAKLRGIATQDEARDAPMHAAEVRQARALLGWPDESIRILTNTLEQGEIANG